MPPRPRPSILERALGAVGLQRRPAAGGHGLRAVYAGAAYNRLTEDWFTSILSADQEIKGDLKKLRGASRALVRDNSYAARYCAMLAENVVGPHGIRLQATFGTTRGGLNAGLNDTVEGAWAAWGEPEACDAAGRLSWVEFQQLVMRTLPQDGEVLVRLLPGFDNAHGFAVQLLDADLLDEQYSVEAGKSATGNEVRMGVEVNRYGRPVAYHLWTEHPSEGGRLRRVRERVSADEIRHLFVPLRPGQSRGVPWFAPVLLDQKMLQGYQEAEVTAARVAASNAAVVTIPDPDKFAGDPTKESGEAVPFDVEPGQWLRLRPGEVLTSTEFDHPSTAFGAFTTSILRSIATGLHVAYTSLTGDLAAVNYSSIRAGLLAERDFYRGLQGWLACHLHRPVFRAWSGPAQLAGVLPVRAATTYTAPDAVKWLPRGWKWVDPLNDVQAAELAVKNGFTTRGAICAETGQDFEENVVAISEENELAEAHGVTLGADAPPAPRHDAPEGAPAEKPGTAAARVVTFPPRRRAADG